MGGAALAACHVASGLHFQGKLLLAQGHLLAPPLLGFQVETPLWS